MDNLFALLFFASTGCLIAGLVKPGLFTKLFKKTVNRKFVSAVFGGASLFFFIALGMVAPPVEKPSTILQSSSQKEVVSKSIDETESDELTDSEHADTAQNDAENTEEESDNELETQEEKKTYVVQRVIDGDSVEVVIDGSKETLRLIGMDTPESVHPTQAVECFGIEASNKAKEILTGKTVYLEADASQGERGKYGRLLRYIILPDGTNFNKLMISEGYAYEYTYGTPYVYQAEFKQAQADAEKNKRGLWADGACKDFQEASPNTPQEQEPEQVSQEPQTPPVEPTPTTGDGHTWYVSSHWSSKQYYCDTDDGWKGLSETYLKSYSSEAALKQDFPNHSLHQPC